MIFVAMTFVAMTFVAMNFGYDFCGNFCNKEFIYFSLFLRF